VLNKLGSLEKELVKFLSAQLVMMIEYLDYLNIVHRDLKPENILINKYFVLKLVILSNK
jgi:serine/threonine protein kinase